MKVLKTVLLCALIVAALFDAGTFAQGSTTAATLSGVIQDTSGGVVPGVTVVVRNVRTGVTIETISNNTGTFSVPALDPGEYEATASLSGFKTVKVDRIGLQAGTPSSVVIKLDVGDMTETVNVTAFTALVETTSTTVASTVTMEQIQNLPVVTRNAMNFITFLPGVNSGSGTHIQRNSTAMGLPGSAISITIDGVNVQDQDARSGDGFYANVRPQTDMVEQVTVSEATATADSSGQGAVQIKFVTRSGANVPTGSVYEYLRDTSLMTNSWQNEFRNLPKNKINWNQFGIRQGGPIVIPGLYDGRNKAFFFFNYEEFRLAVTAATNRTMISPAAQNGLFRYGCSAGGCASEVNLLDLAARNGQISTVDPTISQMFAMINAATQTQGSTTQNLDRNTLTYSWQPPEFRIERFPFGRVDLNLTDSQRLSGTFLYHKINSDPDIVNSGYSSYPDVPTRSTQYSYRQTSTVGLRSAISSNLINEAGFGNIWAPVCFSSTMTPDLFVGGRNFAFLPIAGVTPSPFNVVSNANSRNGMNYSLRDTLSWLKGRHSISMGGAFTQVWNWAFTTSLVPPATLGLDTTLDPAAGLFVPANFPGSTAGELTSARNLYATLTGRVTAINANSTLQSDGTYLYRGDTMRRFRQRELGMFVQDQWRITPTLTLNAGLRYQLQFPAVGLDSIYAITNVDDLCGRAGLGAAASNATLATIGCRVGMPGSPLNVAPAPTYKQYNAGSAPFSLDANNYAPSVGLAWQPNVETGILRKILGDPALATVRASYGRSFNTGGLNEYTGTLTAGPGLTAASNRNVQLGNLVLPGDAGRYGGNGYPVLLRQPERFGAPAVCAAGQTDGCIPQGATYPAPIIFSTGVDAYDPDYQTSYTDSWSVGFQRAIGKNTGVEVRYIGNQNNHIPFNLEYNEIDVFNTAYGSSANFIDEFRKAQANLAANVAAGRGATFAYTGAPGTSPLPIFLAHYTGAAAANAGDPARYTGTQWSNSATIPALSFYNPSIGTFASTNGTNGLFGNPTFRANSLTAGLPANFWVMNPDVQSAILRTAQHKTKYHTLQVLLNRRLSNGLSLTANYAYQEQFETVFDSIFRPYAMLRDVGAPPHALKVTANYELPIGQGRRFGSDMNPWLNGVIGGWAVNFTGRLETGRLWDIGDVRLVNMTLDDLQKQFKFYTNPIDGFVYNLPQELIANTIKAFATDVTSATGRPICTGSNPTTCGGPDETKPYIAPASTVECAAFFDGDCGPRQQLIKAPPFSRFDLSFKKRFPFAQRASFDLQADLLNVFNAINYISVFSTATNPDSYRVTTAYADINNTYDPGGRITQLVFRLNW